MTMRPKVLVSILNYNSFEDTVETIECFQRQTYPNFHLQMIDNASTNNCASKIKELFPSLDIICLPENLGYTGGNNIALETGLDEGYDYVVVSNQDISIDMDFLSRMVEAVQNKNSVGIIGGVEENYFTGEIRAVGGSGYNFWTSRGKWLKVVPECANKIVEVDYAQGSLIAFSQEALLANVRFDPNIFMYGDEADLCFQLKKYALKAFVVPSCRIRHKARPRPFDPVSGYFIQRNRIYLARKYAPVYTFIFNLVYTGLLELPLKILIRSLQGHSSFSHACIAGYMDGLRYKMGIGRAFSM